MAQQLARDEEGNIFEIDAQGNPVRLVQPATAASAPTTVAPSPWRVQQQQRELDRQAAQDARAERSDARAQDALDRPPSGFRWNPDHSGLEPIPGGPNDPNAPKGKSSHALPEGQGNRLDDAVQTYAQLAASVNNFQDNYSGFGSGIENTAQRYLGTGTPGQANWWAQFKALDNEIRNKIFGASLSGAEQAAFQQTTISPGMNPEQIRENLNARLELARQKLARTVGRLKATGYNADAIDAATGEFTEQLQPGYRPAQKERKSVSAARYGQGDNYTDAEGALVSQKLTDAFNNGAGIGDLNAILRKYGHQEFQGNEDEIQNAFKARERGGLVRFNPPPIDPNAGSGVFTDPNSKTGALLYNAVDAATAGLPTYLAGERGRFGRDYMEQRNPNEAFIGGLGGSIAGSAAFGAAAKPVLAALAGPSAVGRAAAWLAANGARASAVGDTAFGGATGALNNPDNPLLGAATGATVGLAGNLGGQAAARTLGGALKGVTDPGVRYLAGRGVPLSPGQLLGNNGVAGRLVQKIESAPVIGDLLGARRLDSFRAYTGAALDDAGSPVGATTQRTGFEGVRDIKSQTSNAYDDATAGVTAPIDAQGNAEMATAMRQGAQLPPDLAARYKAAIETRVLPAAQGGNLTGEGYQQAVRGLKGYRAEAPKPGFEADYRNALSATQDALTGIMNRGGGPDVVQKLAKADEAWRLASTVERAMKAARNGARSGAPEVITPSHLKDAAMRTADKYPGSQPFSDLIKYGEEILPSRIPNSGTADRLYAMALPAALGGTSYSLSDTDPALAGGLAAAAALSTRTGSRLAQRGLLDRPVTLQRLGEGVIKRSRLGGLFGAPLLIDMVNR